MEKQITQKYISVPTGHFTFSIHAIEDSEEDWDTHSGKAFAWPCRKSMVNFWRDEDPRSALNPSNGMLEVPVTNYTKKERGREKRRENKGREREGVMAGLQGNEGRMYYCT